MPIAVTDLPKIPYKELTRIAKYEMNVRPSPIDKECRKSICKPHWYLAGHNIKGIPGVTRTELDKYLSLRLETNGGVISKVGDNIIEMGFALCHHYNARDSNDFHWVEFLV